jgi:hypothetical protein
MPVAVAVSGVGLVALALLLTLKAANAERRFSLVLGNSQYYQHAPLLADRPSAPAYRNDMALAAFQFLASVVTTQTGRSVDFADWLPKMPALGLASRRGPGVPQSPDGR